MKNSVSQCEQKKWHRTWRSTIKVCKCNLYCNKHLISCLFYCCLFWEPTSCLLVASNLWKFGCGCSDRAVLHLPLVFRCTVPLFWAGDPRSQCSTLDPTAVIFRLPLSIYWLWGPWIEAVSTESDPLILWLPACGQSVLWITTASQRREDLNLRSATHSFTT